MSLKVIIEYNFVNLFHILFVYSFLFFFFLYFSLYFLSHNSSLIFSETMYDLEDKYHLIVDSYWSLSRVRVGLLEN